MATRSDLLGEMPADLRLTHPDKILFPEMGLTKRDLVDYYRAVEKLMMPHLAGRYVSLVRCPAGRAKKCFFQKHATSGEEEFIRIDGLAGVLSWVQMNTLEFHIWGSEIADIERPTRLVFDLDPDPDLPFAVVKKGAVTLRGFLDELGLTSFPMLTGGKGVHVVVPVRPRASWVKVKAFCKAIANTLADTEPDAYVANMAKAKRKGRIFVDYLRNDRGATAIAPYSTRARPGATVAAPVSWDELARCRSAAAYNVPKMMRRKSDPWAGYFKIRQSLTVALLKSAGV